ncbi:MAG: Gx transporter family protein, partial [Bacillota bacterium]
LGGRLGAPGFWLSMAGAAASVAVMGSARLWALGDGRRLVVVSVLGGVAHNLGQLGAFRAIIGHDGAAWLLPALVALGTAAGAAIGAGAYRVLPAFERVAQFRLASGKAGRTTTDSVPAATPGRRTLGLVTAVLFLAVLAIQAGAYRVVAGAAGLRAAATRPGEAAVRVEVDGKHVLTLPLRTDRVARLSAGGVQMSLEVRDGRVRVLESTCPRQVCVKTGWIDRPGQVIVCVPARMVITVGRSGQAPSGSMAGADGGPVERSHHWPDVDAITW